ncbi:hypothetical protein FFI89_018895 [Bradyrhizobium sp. KBS0727]|nr:hypothetical protein FFI71_018895 [Bradyrhizobium sp. KBS0725]QDW45637.1 hypothetical protein FFI89_018895 [Bradyrhizobium sp. KBS0727]
MTPTPITEQRLLGAIVIVSEVIVKHGTKYAPLLDRLERELADLRNVDDPVSRARRHLARADLARAPAAAAAPSPAPAQFR